MKINAVTNGGGVAEKEISTREKDLLCVITFFFPLVGWLLYAVMRKKSPKIAGAYLTWAIVPPIMVGLAAPIFILLCFIIYLCFSLVIFDVNVWGIHYYIPWIDIYALKYFLPICETLWKYVGSWLFSWIPLLFL